jgi:hypothetical protein
MVGDLTAGSRPAHHKRSTTGIQKARANASIRCDAIVGVQAFPSTYAHKYSNARNNQSPMLLGPTDAVYDSAKAHGLSARWQSSR